MIGVKLGIREEFEKELSKLKSEYIQKLTETANLL